MNTQDIVDVLNDLFNVGPQAIDALLCNRVPANDGLLDHPTAMCSTKNDEGAFPTIGLLGVIQAIAAKDGDIIEACYDDKRHVLTHFRVRPKEDGETKKYTVISWISWMTGSHRQSRTEMKRIKVTSEETLAEVIEREELNNSMVFLFEGWPHHIDASGDPIPQNDDGDPI